MQALQRANLLLERRQRKKLKKLAQQKNCSISHLVRKYNPHGLVEGRQQPAA